MRIIAGGGKTFVALAAVCVLGGGLMLSAGSSFAEEGHHGAGTAPGHGSATEHPAGATQTPGAKALPSNPQTTCPVMGGKINRKVFADYQGERVYFCCGGCPAEFKKDPAKYVKKLKEAGVTLEKANAQTTCPIMGGKINKGVFTDYQGKRVYFCCGGCPAEFNKNPAKYMKALEAKGIVLEKTPAPPVTK